MTSLDEIALEGPLDERQLSLIAQMCPVRTYKMGETIFSIGDAGTDMYLVLSGEVELIFEAGKDNKHLPRGEFFGELAFIMGEHKRTATIRAAADTTLAVMDADTAKRLTEKFPVLSLSIVRRSCVYLLRSEQELIAHLKKKNEQLQQTLDYLRSTKEELNYQELLAQTDQLTGLYNRRCMDDQLTKLVERTGPTDYLGIIVLDLDGFKKLNDTHGHQKGDELLKEIGRILKNSCRTTDLPCRLGGDEFAILMPSIKSQNGKEVSERVRKSILDLPPVVIDSDLKITGSLGGTLYLSGESAQDFIKRADRNLYQAKREGRNRVVWTEDFHR